MWHSCMQTFVVLHALARWEECEPVRSEKGKSSIRYEGLRSPHIWKCLYSMLWQLCPLYR